MQTVVATTTVAQATHACGGSGMRPTGCHAAQVPKVAISRKVVIAILRYNQTIVLVADEMIDQSASVWLPSPGFEGGTVRFRAVSERPAKPYAISREKVGLNPKSKMRCRLAIAENSRHTAISASDRLARAKIGRASCRARVCQKG